MKTISYIFLTWIVLAPGLAGSQPLLMFSNNSPAANKIEIPEIRNSGANQSADTCLNPVVFDMYITLASCPGACDGTIEVEASGGTPPFTYWYEADSCIGPFTLFVMDAVGCIDSAQGFISSESELALFELQITPSTNNQSDGTVTAFADNGVPPFEYSIDGVTFQWSNVFENLAPGAYCITVRDANGCSIKSDTFLIESTTGIPIINDEWKLYPNPANSMVYLTGKIPFILDLLDANGRTLKTAAAADYLILEVADLPRGLYVVRLQNDTGSSFRKIMLQ